MHLTSPSLRSMPPTHAGPGAGHLFVVGSSLEVTLWLTGGLKRLAPNLQVMTFTQAGQAAEQLRRLGREQWPKLIVLGSTDSQAFLKEVQGESWASELPLLLLTDRAADPDAERTLAEVPAVRAALQRPSKGAGEGVLRLLALYGSGRLSL